MFKRFLRVFALLLALAALAGGAWYLLKTEQEDSTRIDDLYALVEPLKKERDALTQELNSMDLDVALEMRDISTVQVLFREMDRSIFTDAYPIMRERSVTGIIGLNWTEFPLNFNKLSFEQYNRLMRDGWGACLLYDGSLGFTRWYNAMAERMSFYKMEVPTTVYVTEDAYIDGLDEEMAACGITTVIYAASDGHSKVVERVTEPMWHTGAMPWSYTGLVNDLDALALTNGGNLVLTVSFNTMWDTFEEEYFTTVMELIQERLEVVEPATDITEPLVTLPPKEELTPEEKLLTPVLRVTTVEGARAYHEETQAQNDALEADTQKRRAEIEKRIEELDQQTRDIYRQWNMTSSEETHS